MAQSKKPSDNALAALEETAARFATSADAIAASLAQIVDLGRRVHAVKPEELERLRDERDEHARQREAERVASRREAREAKAALSRARYVLDLLGPPEQVAARILPAVRNSAGQQHETRQITMLNKHTITVDRGFPAAPGAEATIELWARGERVFAYDVVLPQGARDDTAEVAIKPAPNQPVA